MCGLLATTPCDAGKNNAKVMWYVLTCHAATAGQHWQKSCDKGRHLVNIFHCTVTTRKCTSVSTYPAETSELLWSDIVPGVDGKSVVALQNNTKVNWMHPFFHAVAITPEICNVPAFHIWKVGCGAEMQERITCYFCEINYTCALHPFSHTHF